MHNTMAASISVSSPNVTMAVRQPKALEKVMSGGEARMPPSPPQQEQETDVSAVYPGREVSGQNGDIETARGTLVLGAISCRSW